MPPDAVRTDSTKDGAPKGPREKAEEALSNLIQRFRQSPVWQMVLAVALILVALVGLCRISGLADQLGLCLCLRTRRSRWQPAHRR